MSLTRVLRKHMKKMLIVLVILIALVFGATYTMTEVFRGWMTGSWARMFGRTVTRAEFRHAQRVLKGRQWGGDSTPGDEVTWEYLAMLEEARRTGITVTNEELKQSILDWYRRQRLFQEIREIEDKDEQTNRYMEFVRLTPQQMKTMLKKYGFSRGNYRRMVERMTDMSVVEFEHTVREGQLLYKLESLVKSSAIVSPSEVYEEFAQKNHQRNIDYLHLDSEHYREKVAVEEEKIEKFYETCKKDYMESERIAFEYVIARYEDIEADIRANPPSEEELKNFYFRVRRRFPRSRDELPDREGVPSPEDRYKPYDKVRQDVYDLYLTRETEKRAKELIDKAREKINALEEITLLNVSEIAAGMGLSAGETGLFSDSDKDCRARLEDEFGFFADARRLFDSAEEIKELSKDKFEKTGDCDKGYLIYRLSKYVPRHSKPLEEVRREIETAYINSQAGAVTLQEAERILEQARTAKGFTDALIKKEKLALVSTNSFKNVDSGGDIKTLKDIGQENHNIIKTVFALEEVHDFADPVLVDIAGKPHYYLVQYKGRAEASAADFIRRRENLIADKRYELEEEILKQWKKDLVQRADIQKPEFEREKEKEEGKKEQPPEQEPAQEKLPQEEPAEEEPAEEEPAEEKPAVEKPTQEQAPEQEPSKEEKD